jgi:hypothetical protein
VRAAKDGLYARKEFADGEGLGDVIVGAEFEAHDFIDLLATRGEHDDGNRRAFGLELLANVQAAHARHHHVENDEVWRIF